MKAGASLEKGELQQLENIRHDINPEELIDEIVLCKEANGDDIFALEIGALAAAILVKPVASQLQKIFTIAKNVPNRLSMRPALESLSYAIKFLSKEERNELFTLTMQIGKAEKENQQHSKMGGDTILLFKAMISNAKYLHPTEVDTLIAFIMNCQGRSDYTELLCALIDAERWNQQLNSVLIAALAERNETDTLYGRMLRIGQFLPEQRHQLVEDVLAIDDEENRAHMLGLLGGRMEHLKSEDHRVILNGILQLRSRSRRSVALRRAAASIVCLEEQNGLRLLEAIKAIDSRYGRARAVSVIQDAVIKKWDGLLQEQAEVFSLAKDFTRVVAIY